MGAVCRRTEPVHEQVDAIVAAAEAGRRAAPAGDRGSVRDRIAEGERAAENRVQAAEEEAADIVKWASEEAARLRRPRLAEAEQAKTEATTEALTVVARAQDQAEIIRAEAEAAKTRGHQRGAEIVARAQETAERGRHQGDRSGARAAPRRPPVSAGDVQTEGLELVANLRQMGDSLRSNAERLLARRPDDPLADGGPDRRAGRSGAGALGPIRAHRPGRRAQVGETGPTASVEVPEFIPPG